MPLRKSAPVTVDQEAAKESTSHIDMDINDDPAPEVQERQDPPAPASLRQAEPPAERAVQTEIQAVAEPEVELDDGPNEVKTVDAPPANALAAAATATPASVAPSGDMVAASGRVQDQLAAAGFEGLNFGFGSFPIITLQNNGQFESSDGGSLGTGFYCVLFSSVQKWIFKNDAKGKDEDFCYSYDEVTATDGRPVAEKISAWEANGQKWEKKPYVDVQAKMITDDEDDGQMVLLSVPKTSIPRFSGYTATLMARGKLPNQVVTQVTIGDKVTKVQYPFCPWTFKYFSDCNA